MSEQQLALIGPEPVQLTERQQAVLNLLQHAGQDGIETADAGALLHSLRTGSIWQHPATDRCRFCERDGRNALKRLRTLGHARESRKLKVWLAINPVETVSETQQEWDGAGPVPYGHIPF